VRKGKERSGGKGQTCDQFGVNTFAPSASMMLSPSDSASLSPSSVSPPAVEVAVAAPLVFVPPAVFVVADAFSLIQLPLKSIVVLPYIPPVCTLKLAPSLSETGRLELAAKMRCCFAFRARLAYFVRLEG
jgi:hypothetical protein